MIECKVRALYCQLYLYPKQHSSLKGTRQVVLSFAVCICGNSPSAFSWSTLHMCGSLAYREYILAAMHHDVQEGAHFGKLTGG